MEHNTEKKMTSQESLELITNMIGKVRESYHDTGLGPILWGAVIAICSLVTWARIQYGFKLPFDVWLLTIIALVPQVIISYRQSRARLVKSYNEIALDAVWICFGISMFLLTTILTLTHQGLNEHLALKTDKYAKVSYVLYEYQNAFFLLVYGFPTIVTGVIMNFRPMIWGGILCWVCLVICLFTDIKTDMLLMALSALMAWFIPGLIINRNYRQKRPAADV
jgi:hypothetical protein